MVEIWYAILAFTLIVYVTLDGRNFGAGILHLIVTKTPSERRQVIAAIGPLCAVLALYEACFARLEFGAFDLAPSAAASNVKLGRLGRLRSLIGGIDHILVMLQLRLCAADVGGVRVFKGRGYILPQRLARLRFRPFLFGSGQLKLPYLTPYGQRQIVNVALNRFGRRRGRGGDKRL